MEENISNFFKRLWKIYINKFRIPYLEFVFIIYFSLQLFNFVAIPEKDLLKQNMSYLSLGIGLIILLDCIKSWWKYIDIYEGQTDIKEVFKRNILKTIVLFFPIIMNFIHKILSSFIISHKEKLHSSQLGLLYILFVLISSLIFVVLLVRFSMKSGFWIKGWVSLILALYMFIAYSFSLIYYIGDYYSVSNVDGFSFSEKLENEILARNVLIDFDKDLHPFQENNITKIITEKQNKIGYTVIDVEGNDLNITSDMIGENWANYYYSDLIKNYNLFSILSMSDFEFTQDSFIKSYSNIDYNKFLNGNYKLLKIALYKLPSEDLNGSILKDKSNGEGLDQYVEKYMYLIVAEENLTNYLIFESQRNHYILLNELLEFSNVLLDDTITDINMIIHEGISKSFFDYFYYSFIVITTLGFGDITPVSQLFRSLTVLEAVLGLIIMGLFLAKVFESKQ